MLKLIAVAFIAQHVFGQQQQNTYFDLKSDEVKQYMLGTRMDGKHSSRDHRHADAVDSYLPDRFHSDQQWPHCASTINYIKDQAACGSCWAVAASSVMADRACINCNGLCNGGPSPPPSPTQNPCTPEEDKSSAVESKKNKDGTRFLNEAEPCLIFSAEQLLSCCSYCGSGCQGGYPIDAMRYWVNSGLVTGGWYGSRCGCQPYEINPSSHSSVRTPQCEAGYCQPGFPISFQQDKHYGRDHYTIAANVAAIKTEIMRHGPVECAFTVYGNFYSYPRGVGIYNGVYYATSGGRKGGHAIKITGWDVDAYAGPYWIIHNSWNTTWGLNGRFHYRMGVDLGGMESGCVAGMPKCQNVLDNKLKCIY